MSNAMPEETKRKIIDLWQAGLSSGDISNQLSITRNSVMGFVARQRANGVPLREARWGGNNVAKKAPKKIMSFMERQLPASKRTNLEIHELTNKSCRFIVTGEGKPVRYCGDPISQHSYCATHLSICYTPARKS